MKTKPNHDASVLNVPSDKSVNRDYSTTDNSAKPKVFHYEPFVNSKKNQKQANIEAKPIFKE